MLVSRQPLRLDHVLLWRQLLRQDVVVRLFCHFRHEVVLSQDFLSGLELASLNGFRYVGTLFGHLRKGGVSRFTRVSSQLVHD